jgi:hypothetical protein
VKGSRKQPSPATLLDGLPRDYRPMARAAIVAGWTITRSGNGHTKLRSPDGQTIPLPGSGRVALGLYKHITAQVRKAGVEW